MARGGQRDGAGRPKGSKTAKRPRPAAIKSDAAVVTELPAVAGAGAVELREGWIEPLVYMMAVYNDPTVDDKRRDKMAVEAAPYRHSKSDEVGKKQQRQTAAENVTGKFEMPAAPRLVVSNKK